MEEHHPVEEEEHHMEEEHHVEEHPTVDRCHVGNSVPGFGGSEFAEI